MLNEVESILNEIRERVRNDQEQSSQVAIPDETAKDSLPRPVSTGHSEMLTRLSAHLTTTSRAWDRLPPLYSNRRGGAARFELWIKARLKSMSRWFTWEQVNFNSAVHHALSETLHALSASQQELAGLRAELREEAETWREKFGRSDRELSALRAGIDALTEEIRKQEARNAAIEARSGALEARATETAVAMTKEFEAMGVQITCRLAELAGELRTSDQQLREEHRVCFKQLSLEASEAAVREGRGLRVIQSRLDKLEKAVSNGEQ